MIYTSSDSIGDVASLSLFGTASLSQANADAVNAYNMMAADPTGYLGSATVATEANFSATVPSQATPDLIAAVADSFVGQAWNLNGCWGLASTIAAEAGASLPVQSTAVGLAGQANGEWIVAYNGPAGQSGNWQSMVTAGEIVVFATAGGGGHIATCVAGSGSTALLVDNVTYVNGSGQILNPANDGSASDVIVASPHPASQEWSALAASSVVIYELDTPVVTGTTSSASLVSGASLALASLFSATDPVEKAITKWQVYNTASSDWLAVGATDLTDNTAASALTATSLASVSLLAGSLAVADTLEVRAYNGSYWGDWTSLAVAVRAATAPVVSQQTPAKAWLAGQAVALTLAAGTFADPQNEVLSYQAALAGGQALPGWLTFDATTETFSGTAPAAAQTLSIVVTATDTSGLSATETVSATVIGAPVVAVATANQNWIEGKALSFVLPTATFSDPQNEALSCQATLSNGQALPGWLTFNAATETFTGTAPAAAAQVLDVAVTATDTSGLSVSESFNASVAPAAGHGAGVAVSSAPTASAQAVTSAKISVSVATSAQIWTDGQDESFVLPATTFVDLAGSKMIFAAYEGAGESVSSWLHFDAASNELYGTAPTGTSGTIQLEVVATNTRA